MFLSFNFLEHQPDPGTMLECIRENLAEDGMGLITVPSLEYILQYDGYYELIRDHIAYYSFDTLERLLALHGFQVLEKEMVNRDTCSVIVRKVKEKKTDMAAALPELDFSALEKSHGEICRQTRTPGTPQAGEENPGPLGRQPPGIYSGSHHMSGRDRFLYYGFGTF